MRRNNLFRSIIVGIVIIWSLAQLYPTMKVSQLQKEAKTYTEQLQALSNLDADEIQAGLNAGDLPARLEDAIQDDTKLTEAYALAEKAALLHDGIVKLENDAIKQGLDLLGGTYLVYEVNLPQLVLNVAKKRDSRLDSLLAKIELESGASESDYFNTFSQAFNDAGIRMSLYFGQRIQKDEEIVDKLKEQAADAVNRTLEVLRNRVDQFGVSEPSITKQGDNRIIIELAGIKDVQRAKEIIGKTALLEFKLVKDPDVNMAILQDIDKALKKKLSRSDAVAELTATNDSTATRPSKRKDTEVSVESLFGEGTTIGDESEGDSTILVDEQLAKDSPFLALLTSFPGSRNSIGLPAKNLQAVKRIVNSPEVLKIIPANAQVHFSNEPQVFEEQEYYEMYFLKKEAEITGKYLEEADVSIASGAQSFNQGQPQVNLKFNSEGARIFAVATGANVNKQLAIVLDGKVASAPNISGKIPGGSAQIEGSFTMEEAKDLAIVLRAGALPAPIHVIEERTVGPSLGQDSVNAGQLSLGIGIALVILFMIVYYKLSGLIADVALILNLVLILAALAFFHATLTLPGIAGIILTMGMAVDANVLIFERIREELATGKTVRAAIDAGYDRAFWTIFDANITTFLTALVLYQFGTGPIRGFAVTLSIGILASMFTAIVVTHLIYDTINGKRSLSKLSI
ncbi:MAG: protein translocase subunit SecD [Calditrichaeota bacterium]|nr:MAG: protein translocase subunit SecD [Calditrichota bacterium]